MTTENKSELDRLSLIRTNNARRRRLSLLRRKSTTTHVDVAGKYSGGKTGTDSGTLSPAREESVAGACGSRAKCQPCGSASVIGRRREMEDSVRVELGFMSRGEGSVSERFDFYGVFDGHGGAWVAEACGDRLHHIVAENGGGGGGGSGWEEVMVRCFGKMDEEVTDRAAGAAACGGAAAEAMKMVGSTAVVAVVGKEVVVVANCGDSRAVLSRGGIALALSSDHKPDRPDELKRIEAAGGRVINWNGHRVLGVLNTSRSIGDQHLKPYVIPEPEVTISQRSPSDEFLILASDGLWDVVSNEVACQVVRRCLDGRIKRRSGEVVSESRAAEAAAVLAEFAVTRGSDDNVSVLIVKL